MTTLDYDQANRIRTVTSNPDGYYTVTDYDNLDPPTQITYPDGTNQQFQYSQDFGQGLTTILDLTVSTDRRGRPTTRHYNRNRQMDSITDPLMRTTHYNWCNCGALESIVDANTHTTTFNRDLESRVYQKVFDDHTAINYVYENTMSRLKSMTDALGQTTNYQYGVDDNLLQVSYTNVVYDHPNVSFTSDPNYNRLKQMVDETGTTQDDYYPVDPGANLPAFANRLKSESNSHSTIIYGYDELGRTVSQSVDGVASSVSYDLGWLSTSDNQLGHFSRIYDLDVTPRLKTNYPNGQTSNYDYFDKLHDMRFERCKTSIQIWQSFQVLLHILSRGRDSNLAKAIWHVRCGPVGQRKQSDERSGRSVDECHRKRHRHASYAEQLRVWVRCEWKSHQRRTREPHV